MKAVFSVYFEGPFWVGVLEREDEDGFLVARHVFGAEPTNPELLAFVRDSLHLMRRVRTEGPAEKPAGSADPAPPNPKRAIRLARKEATRSMSTRAQAALKAGLEAGKLEARTARREAGEAEAGRRFSLRQEKRKERHRGH